MVVENVVENIVGDALLIFLVIMLSKLTCMINCGQDGLVAQPDDLCHCYLDFCDEITFHEVQLFCCSFDRSSSPYDDNDDDGKGDGYEDDDNDDNDDDSNDEDSR